MATKVKVIAVRDFVLPGPQFKAGDVVEVDADLASRLVAAGKCREPITEAIPADKLD